MSSTKKCKRCERPFEGRANRLYCSAQCKNQTNNQTDLAIRKTNRFWAKHFENNERIFNNFMKNSPPRTTKIYKSDLKAFGFCVHGPFWVVDNDIYIGTHRLRDKGHYFEVRTSLFFDLERSYKSYDFEVSLNK